MFNRSLIFWTISPMGAADHMAMMRQRGTPPRCSSAAAEKASGKFAMKIPAMSDQLTEPSPSRTRNLNKNSHFFD